MLSQDISTPTAKLQSAPALSVARVKVVISRALVPLGWPLSLLALTVCFVGVNWSFFSHRAVPLWDAADGYGPYYTLIADHARHERFLLWDPWTDAGVPACADPQLGAFSPLTIAAGLVTGPYLQGFLWYWLAGWLLGGVGMLLLARRLGAPPWGGLVAALALLFSGFCLGNAEHVAWIHALGALPWVLWRLDVAVLDRRILPAVQAGALFGLSALSGYPAMLMANAGVAVWWALGRALWPPCDPGPGTSAPAACSVGRIVRLRSAAVSLTIMCAVAAVILSPAYGAFLREAPGYTQRGQPLTRAAVISSNAL